MMPRHILFICVLVTFEVSLSFPYSKDVVALPVKFLPGKQVGTLQTKLIAEASGIAASRKNPGILWVHNDSQNSPNIFAITPEGRLVATCRLKGAVCLDWEDIAIAHGRENEQEYLYIGDIGDNNESRSSIIIYRLTEPEIDPNLSSQNIELGPVDSIELVYPDKPKDAEALLVDSLTGDIYVVTKRHFFSRIYRAKYPQSISHKNEMELACVLPWGFATGGDISPDGRLIIIRGMYNASMWIRQENGEFLQAFARQHYRLELMPEKQGEAICFDAEGLGYYTTSEGLNSPIFYFPGEVAKNTTSD